MVDGPGRTPDASAERRRGVLGRAARSEGLLFALGVLVASAVLFREHFSTRPWAIQDYTPWFRTRADAWTVFSSAWNDAWLGSFNPGNPGVFVAQLLLTLVIPSVGLAERLLYLGQLPAAAIGMYVLLRYLGVTPWARMLVAVLYAVNGFTLPLFHLGAFPTLVVHTAFPYYLLASLRFLRTPELRPRVGWLLVATAIVALDSLFQPYALVRLTPFFGAFLVLELSIRRDQRYAVQTLALTGGSVALLFLLVLPFSLDQVQNVIRAFAGTTDTIGFYNAQPMSEVLSQTRVAYLFPETARSYESMTALLLLMSATLVRIRSRHQALMAAASLSVGILGLFWARLLASGHAFEVFSVAPPMLIFRNPDKLGELVLQALMIPLAFGLDGFEYWLTGGRARRRVQVIAALGAATVGVMLFVLVSDAHTPFDDRVTTARRFFSGGIEPGLVSIGTVPETFDDVADWLDERKRTEGAFRSLWLPASRDVYSSIIPQYARDAAVVTGELSELVALPFVEGQSPAFPEIVADLGVKYVLITHPQFEAERLQKFYSGPPVSLAPSSYFANFEIGGGFEEMRKLVEAYPQFEPRASGDGWIAYENRAFRGVDRAYSRVYLVQQARSPVMRSIPNLLQNSELTEDGKGWSLPPVAGSTYSFTGQQGPGGAELQIDVAPGVGWGEFGQEVGVSEGKYLMAVWARASGTTAISFRVYFSDARGLRVKAGGSDYLRVNLRLRDASPDQWQQLSASVSVPAGARTASLVFEARPNRNLAKGATTWFSGPYFASEGQLPLSADPSIVGQGSPLPRARIPWLEGGAALLRGLPFVGRGSNLVLFSDLADSAQTLAQWQELADVAVFLGDVPPEGADSRLLKAPQRLQVFEAEEQALKAQPGVSSTLGADGSVNGVRGSRVSFEIVPPQAGRYWVLVSGPSAAASISFDGSSRALRRLDAPEVAGSRWWMTDPIEIGPRVQRFRFMAATPQGVDQIVLVSARPGQTLEDVLAPPAPVVSWTKESPSRYTARVETAVPALVMLGQRYHGDWQARAGGELLVHAPVSTWGWANGFRVPAGSQDVTLEFSRQPARDAMLIAWSATWLATLTAIVVLFAWGYRRWARRPRRFGGGVRRQGGAVADEVVAEAQAEEAPQAASFGSDRWMERWAGARPPEEGPR